MRACSQAHKAIILSLAILTAGPLFWVSAHAGSTSQSTHPTITSVHSPEFAAVSKDKVLFVISPDFPKIGIKLFEAKKVPNSQVVFSEDIPSKKAAIFVNGQIFRFTGIADSKMYEYFSVPDITEAYLRLRKHLETAANID